MNHVSIIGNLGQDPEVAYTASGAMVVNFSIAVNEHYKDKDGNKDFVHTISATAVTDRVAIAILENNQQADGSVIIPEVLRPLTGFDRIEPVK